LVDTGEKTMTGGRLKRVKEYVGNETFCMTYGDGVADIDLTRLIDFHRREGVMATLTAVQPPGRFGAFRLDGEANKVLSFKEKPKGDGAWINGGFFVLEPGVIDYIADDGTTWEQEPMQDLARDGKLSAYKHAGFWQSMDTLRDKNVLEELWQSGRAPWKIW
jgi:glucose-1-phosphate cytidylyltransferase